MSDQNSPIRIPENPEDTVSFVEEDTDEESDEQNRNLIQAHYRFIE